MSEFIGTGRCPVCASSKARYSLSSKGLVVLTCNGCNFQGFARSERSDELLRANIRPEADPPAPSPSPTPAPTAGPTPAPTPPPKRKVGWGIFAGQEE